MNEAEWLASSDPQAVLDGVLTPAVCGHLGRLHRGERKVRLFAVACCRRVWNLLSHESSRRAVEAAERMAELTRGHQNYRGLDAEHAAAVAAEEAVGGWAFERAASAAALTLSLRRQMGWEIVGLSSQRFSPGANEPLMADEVCAYALVVAKRCRIASSLAAGPALEQAVFAGEQSKQIAYLKCLFGNPYRPVSVDAAWMSWNDGTVRKMAQAIYDDRAFDRLPLLADALEEAGCETQEILDHGRSGGEHVRGCWVIDLLLGKS